MNLNNLLFALAELVRFVQKNSKKNSLEHELIKQSTTTCLNKLWLIFCQLKFSHHFLGGKKNPRNYRMIIILRWSPLVKKKTSLANVRLLIWSVDPTKTTQASKHCKHLFFLFKSWPIKPVNLFLTLDSMKPFI